MSVVLATHEFAPFRGGVATYVQEIALAARHLGMPVTVWTVDYGNRSSKPPGEVGKDAAESSAEVPVVRLSSSGRLTPGGLLSLAWGFWRRRREWRGQAVVLLSVGAQMAFFLLAVVGCRALGPVTCFFHGSEILRFRRNPFWRQLARRFYRRNATRFGVTTRYVETLLRESGLLPMGAEIVLAPCALPTMFHVEHGKALVAQEESAATTSTTFRVLTVARLHPRKGQLEVARALALLPVPQRERVVYQMVGVGKAAYRRQVEAACREGGVRCEFLGAVDDQKLAAIYARATLYAQASRTLAQSVEGFGITFLEASAYGCAIAAWRSGGVAEAVLDGETGLLVEEGDVAGLSTAVERLLGDAELRQQVGERGRAFACTFCWQGSARTLCMGTSLPGT